MAVIYGSWKVLLSFSCKLYSIIWATLKPAGWGAGTEESASSHLLIERGQELPSSWGAATWTTFPGLPMPATSSGLSTRSHLCSPQIQLRHGLSHSTVPKTKVLPGRITGLAPDFSHLPRTHSPRAALWCQGGLSGRVAEDRKLPTATYDMPSILINLTSNFYSVWIPIFYVVGVLDFQTADSPRRWDAIWSCLQLWNKLNDLWKLSLASADLIKNPSFLSAPVLS